jgi:hypothetical protein
MNSYRNDNQASEGQGEVAGVLSDTEGSVPSVSLYDFIEELLRQPAPKPPRPPKGQRRRLSRAR